MFRAPHTPRGPDQNLDVGKLVNGRKRHVVVDTPGPLPGVMVTAADTGDRAAAHVLLTRVAGAHHRPALVWADGGYTRQFDRVLHGRARAGPGDRQTQRRPTRPV
ncbi:transposase [Streptomyces sp. NPDC001880]